MSAPLCLLPACTFAPRMLRVVHIFFQEAQVVFFRSGRNAGDGNLSFEARIMTREEQWVLVKTAFLCATSREDFLKAIRIAFMFTLGVCVGARSEDLGGMCYSFFKRMEAAPSRPVNMPVRAPRCSLPTHAYKMTECVPYHSAFRLFHSSLRFCCRGWRWL